MENGKLDKLAEEEEVLVRRLEEVETDLDSFLSIEQTETVAMLTRILLIDKYKKQDWRQMSHEDTQRFLFHLFGEQSKLSKTGAFVDKNDKA